MGYSHKNSKGITYYLNKGQSKLTGGYSAPIYYFSGKPKSETACDLPNTHKVVENPRNGVPFLKKK
ncbi:MAG: hypothetical protein OXF85_01335 [Candidatus Saccharibacteria bacterium]|nr:hypothetical protein [Candidatus Saccharibacteria bacterium]